jgi:hypothetical protein
VDAILHLIDWLVANKVIGVPVAVAIALGLSGVGWWLRQRRDRPTFSAHTRDGNIQQLNVTGTRSKGDVNITQRQE